MSRTSQEPSTAFGEVLRPATQNYSHNLQGRIVSNDNRLMIYSQGMKIYVPEDFNPGTLLKLLQTLKKLWWSGLLKEHPIYSFLVVCNSIMLYRIVGFPKCKFFSWRSVVPSIERCEPNIISYHFGRSNIIVIWCVIAIIITNWCAVHTLQTAYLSWHIIKFRSNLENKLFNSSWIRRIISTIKFYIFKHCTEFTFQPEIVLLSSNSFFVTLVSLSRNNSLFIPYLCILSRL